MLTPSSPLQGLRLQLRRLALQFRQAQVPARYRLSWARLNGLLLPPALRRPRLLALLQALTWPLRLRYDDVLVWMATMRREAGYNGQTLVLEQALNDQFVAVTRTIVVRNNTGGLLPHYLYFTDEYPPVSPGGTKGNPYYKDNQERTFFFIPRTDDGPLLNLGFASELGKPGFTVYAPGLATQDDQLRRRINQLKMATTQYSIVYAPAPSI